MGKLEPLHINNDFNDSADCEGENRQLEFGKGFEESNNDSAFGELKKNCWIGFVTFPAVFRLMQSGFKLFMFLWLEN